jgi:hypothetical protein
LLTLKRFVLAGTVAVLLAGLLAPSSTATPSAGVFRFEWAKSLWIMGNHAPYTGYSIDAHRVFDPTRDRFKTVLQYWRAPCRRLQEDLLCEVSRRVRRVLEPQDFVMYPTVHGARLTFDQGEQQRVFSWSGAVEEPTGYSYSVGPQGGHVLLLQWNWPDVQAEGTLYGRDLPAQKSRFGSLMTITTTYAYPSAPRGPREIPWGDDGGRVIIRHTN